MTRAKPHLNCKAGIWLCAGMRVNGVGSTPRAAYQSWSYFLSYHKEKRS